MPETRPDIPAGYLPFNALPDSRVLLPPPPSAGSVALALDEDVNRRNRALRGTSRWTLAAEDANPTFPWAAGTFSCALNAPITERDTPRLYRLLRRTIVDAGSSTSAAKDHFRRTRPFVVNKEPTCTPEWEKVMDKDDSYPSGHSATGWAWALILSEVSPERADAILARGLAYGQSRVVCNVHWQSDVVAGRLAGAGAVARLHADSAFRADVEAAKGELAAVRAKGLTPVRDCAAEAAALAEQPPVAP